MDKALKQRLVGASVLIALAVIVLPMLFSGPSEGLQEARSIQVPSRPSELSFETRRFPVGQPVSAQGDEEADAGLNELQPSPIPAPVQAQPEAVSADNERAAVAPEAGEAGGSATTSDSAPDAQPGRYLVQVASFSTVENTNNLSTRLREDGLPVLLDTIEADAGILHRVRVGPFDDASAANAALETIRSRTPDLNPRIIDLRPDESAPVTEPSDPLVRWVVQAGSFSDQENAQDLVTRLRNEGYAAYVVTVTDAASTQYKVRIGPEIERQMALDIAAGIAEKLNLDGIVMSVD